VRGSEEREARGGEAGEGRLTMAHQGYMRHNRSIAMAHQGYMRHKQLDIKVIRIAVVVMDRTTHMA
jgi:hypothetical protein